MSSNTLKEAGRVMTICNSCRYCEGFCAVFPAMELRRTFTSGDLKYLANLCHNCRDCYYACQYAPPHDFDLNFPKAMAELRLETYSEFASPKFLSIRPTLFRLPIQPSQEKSLSVTTGGLPPTISTSKSYASLGTRSRQGIPLNRSIYRSSNSSVNAKTSLRVFTDPPLNHPKILLRTESDSVC